MPKERNSFKYKVWRIVVSTPFEYFIMMLIVFNTLLLMMKVRFTNSNIRTVAPLSPLCHFMTETKTGSRTILTEFFRPSLRPISIPKQQFANSKSNSDDT